MTVRDAGGQGRGPSLTVSDSHCTVTQALATVTASVTAAVPVSHCGHGMQLRLPVTYTGSLQCVLSNIFSLWLIPSFHLPFFSFAFKVISTSFLVHQAGHLGYTSTPLHFVYPFSLIYDHFDPLYTPISNTPLPHFRYYLHSYAHLVTVKLG